MRWGGALLATAVLSVFAFLLITGEYTRAGPVLLRLSATHGVHRGDVGIVALWALGVIGVLTAAASGSGGRRVASRGRGRSEG